MLRRAAESEPNLLGLAEATRQADVSYILRDLEGDDGEKRARFVLAKIDQILEWERDMDRERDTRFVDLGRYPFSLGASGGFLAVKLIKETNFASRPAQQSAVDQVLILQAQTEIGTAGAAVLGKTNAGPRSRFFLEECNADIAGFCGGKAQGGPALSGVVPAANCGVLDSSFESRAE